jgi:hypothetical protein
MNAREQSGFHEQTFRGAVAQAAFALEGCRGGGRSRGDGGRGGAALSAQSGGVARAADAATTTTPFGGAGDIGQDRLPLRPEGGHIDESRVSRGIAQRTPSSGSSGVS